MKKFTTTDMIYFVLNIVTLLVGLKYYSIFSYFEVTIVIAVIGLFVLIYGLASSNLSKILCFFISILISIYLVTQTIYYRAFWTYYRLSYALSMLGTLSHFTDNALVFIGKRDIVIIIFLCIILIIGLFAKTKEIIKIKKITLISFGLLMMLGGVGAYAIHYKNIKENYDKWYMGVSEYYIYDTIPSDELFVKNFGFLTYLTRDIQKTIEIKSLDDKKSEIDEYLLSRGDKRKNMMSGVFKDKSVLIIEAESLTDIAINEKLTPTLWKLKNNGIFVDGFNTPLLPGSTSDSEFMANVSLIPDSLSGSSNNEYPYNTYKVSLPKMFAYEGYVTLAYHNLWETMYNRNEMFSQLGYSSYKGNVGVLDSQEVDKIIPDLVSNEYKKMVFWISLSGHGAYSLTDGYFTKEEYDEVMEAYPNLEESNAVYLAKNIDLDRAIEKVMTSLEESGYLSNWVIVIYGDHYAKGIDYSANGNLLSNVGDNGLAKNTDLIIYNSDIKSYRLKKVGTTLDIIPTLANMFDLKYQYRTIIGKDLFDENYHGFFFSNQGIIETNDYLYDANTDTIEYKESSEIEEKQAREEIEIYKKLPEISRNILKLDYFKDE